MLPLEMVEELVPYECIEPGENPRKNHTSRYIDELADSIEENGLIENLVGYRVSAVYPTEDGDQSMKVASGYRIRLRAGRCRWLAIGRLIERKKWPKDRPVRVSIDPNMTASRDALVSISENVHRETMYPWELGQAYCDLLDHGWKQAEIAQKIGKTQTTISKYVHIARCLHPKIKELLVRIPPGNVPNILKLGDVARLWDRLADEPDFDKQKKALEKILGTPKAPKRSTAERAGVAFFASRVKTLQGSSFHPDIDDFARGMLRFIAGETDEKPAWHPPSRQKVAPLRGSPSRVTSSSPARAKTGKRSIRSG